MKTDLIDLDLSWPDQLQDSFRMVVCDEAHILKSLSSNGSTTIKWLNAGFHVLATASPMPNGITDWSGYRPFIEHKDADQWWIPESLVEPDPSQII